jgi:hypothetical protein
MIGDTINFIKLVKWNSGIFKLGDDTSMQICGKGCISIDKKIIIKYFLYFKGIFDNIISVIQMCTNGYNLLFNKKGCEIRK